MENWISVRGNRSSTGNLTVGDPSEYWSKSLVNSTNLGDFWLAIAAVAESMGLAFVVIALFTGIFYAAMFAVTLLRIIA